MVTALALQTEVLARVRAAYRRIDLAPGEALGMRHLLGSEIPGDVSGWLVASPMSSRACFGTTLAEALRYAAYQLCYELADDGLVDASDHGLTMLASFGVPRVEREEFTRAFCDGPLAMPGMPREDLPRQENQGCSRGPTLEEVVARMLAHSETKVSP